MVFFFIIYGYLLNHPAYPTRVMPLTVVDDWVSFHPAALIPYCSLWIYVSLAPALLDKWWELKRYIVVTAGLSFSGFLSFYFFPTAVPSPGIDWAEYPAIAFLKESDDAGNACPSLHVAFSVYSGLILAYLWAKAGGRFIGQTLNALWALVIIHSTMATKQHVFLDVVFGAILGILGGWLIVIWLRSPPPVNAEAH
jgi:membrane-associated phospholipid phosphatase